MRCFSNTAQSAYRPMACTSTTEPERSSQAAFTTASTGPASTQRPAEEAVSNSLLDDQYEACLLAGGFNPEGVQLLLDEGGRPWWVKTGHDVPAKLHGRCFQQIGGEPTGLSSHGIDSTE